jgi:RNA polymerase sigma-70 factor, ECF subfamily
VQKRLIRHAQKGDASAYDTLFATYEKDLYRMAFIYTRNEQDALDVVQETAYRSFKAIHTLQQPAFFKTWLIRILYNCAKDLLKKRHHFEEIQPELVAVTEEVDLHIHITLEHVMNELSQEEKAVVLLKYYEDYTFEQIADCLQMKLGTTKTILYRALKKLKRALEREEGASVYEQFKR